MHSKAFLFFLLLALFSSCKKSTSFQIVLFNELPDQVRVKVYASSLNLIEDSIVLEPAQQYELYFKEEDGLNSVYHCKNLLDSVFMYSNAHKIKVQINNTALWTYSENPSKYKEQHRCSLAIGAGDTIQ